MLKGLIKSVLFFTILVSISLPTVMAFWGPAVHHHKHVAANHKAGGHILETGGHHDNSWELIKKRHMSAPPAIAKVRVLLAVSLLAGLFCFGLVAAQPNLSFVTYNSRNKPFPPSGKYIIFSSFLI